jgi:lactoylglutathione lyase
MRFLAISSLLFCSFVAVPFCALAQPTPQHPRIIGLSHVALYAGDIGAERLFYEEVLGFSSPFTLKHPDGTDWIVNVKVNDEQFIELFAEPPKGDGPLNHFALCTDNAKLLADEIKGKGVQLVSELHTGQTGNDFFALRDPDGHLIEIVEYSPSGRTAQDRGFFLPSTRASNHILSVGIRVRSAALETKFYREILGLQEVSRIGPSATQPGSIILRVPDGDDEIRLLLFIEFPSQQTTDDYVSLADTRVLEADHSSNATPGPNHSKNQTGKAEDATRNLYDPAGMRIEMKKVTPSHHGSVSAASPAAHNL